MKKVLPVGLMMLGLFATSVQAETKHCHTVEDCQKLSVEVEADMAANVKNVMPELTGILKIGVNYYEAEKICADEGMRLPTARELALVAQSLGAQGISERFDRYGRVLNPEKYGFRVFFGTDTFYYNRTGYNRPEGDLGSKYFWSSSNDYGTVHQLHGDSGHIFEANPSEIYDKDAVRCVQPRGIFTKTAQAETKHCHTIEDCQQLRIEVEADLALNNKNAMPELTEVLQTGVNQYEAKRICADKGMRLPTARELAVVAQSLGAKGIRERKFSSVIFGLSFSASGRSASTNVLYNYNKRRNDRKNKREGYEVVGGKNSEGNHDYFYYNKAGYKRPEGDLGINSFWSSTTVHDTDTYLFIGDSGTFIKAYESDISTVGAVRCVQ